ncbi:MAG: ATP-binding protein [Spirochaetes bacterium]|nr:ATP-binding protein [Spirochaetota bacterium]
MESSLFYEKIISNIEKLSINDLKKLLKNLYSEKIFFVKFLDEVDDGIIIIDKNYKLLYINRKATVIFKRNYLEEIRDDLPDIIINEINNLNEKNKKIKGIVLPINILKEKYLFEFNLYFLGEAFNNAIAIIFYDINAKYLKEREESISKALSNIIEMTYTFAHEVRNPLTSLDLNLLLLGKELQIIIKENEKCIKCKEIIDDKIEILRNEVKRINSIVDKFLNTTKPLKPNFQKVKINEVIEETSKVLINDFISNNKKLSLCLKNDLEEIFLDPDLLKQIIINLVKNGLDAINNVKNGKVIIKTNSDEKNIYIEVIDNGEGIPQENMDKLFMPFFTTKANGTGLGLTIVYRIINNMGGQIYVKSTLNKGTTFKIVFPKSRFKNISIPFYEEKID